MFSVGCFERNYKKKKRKDKSSLPVRKKWNTIQEKRLPRAFSSAFKRASLTLEAACVLPLFLYFMAVFMYLFPAVSVQGSVMNSLWQTGKELAVYAYAFQSGEGVSGMASGALTASYAKGKVISNIKKEQINTAVIRGGPGGISLAGSSFLEKEMIRLRAAYLLKFPLSLFPLKEFNVVQEIAVRAWTGREGLKSGESGDGQENQMVYVTAQGEVYHRDENCSHIRLSVRLIDKSRISQLRNESGGKYYPCEGCGSGMGQSVYITDTGDRYHSFVNCRGLKRSVMKVPVSSLDGWRPCLRCGG